MAFTHSIKNITETINANKNKFYEMENIIQAKGNNFSIDITNKLKEFESIIKKLKAEIKSINVEVKQITKALNEGKGILDPNDFSDLIANSSSMSIKDLSLRMALEKPVVEWKGIISKKIQGKFLPIESWADEKIVEEFSNSSLYPTNKDIFSKLPKAYKPKTLPKKREDVIKKIIEHANKLRSGFIIDKV
jgi:hypothetical protein